MCVRLCVCVNGSYNEIKYMYRCMCVHMCDVVYYYEFIVFVRIQSLPPVGWASDAGLTFVCLLRLVLGIRWGVLAWSSSSNSLRVYDTPSYAQKNREGDQSETASITI